jgi:hypothetical protein
MKTGLALLACLLAPLIGPSGPVQQGEKSPPKDAQKKSSASVTPSVLDEGEQLAQAVEGSWMLFDYTDPAQLALDDVASGFASFHDGFLTLMLAMDTLEQRFFRMRERLVLDAGVYRYRFDEQGLLQLSSVLSYTNQTENGEMEPEPAGQVLEYYTIVDDGVLELRDADGIELSFRKVEAGKFPDSAIRRLERYRSGTPQWEELDGPR